MQDGHGEVAQADLEVTLGEVEPRGADVGTSRTSTSTSPLRIWPSSKVASPRAWS